CNCRVEPCTTKDYPTKARRPAHSVLGCDKIQKVYDVVPPAWDDALKRCLKALNGKQDAEKNENL
ncbi:MAG: NAD(P)-dependent oxidoreductase, partial [Prevotellaceae bacterium]|nr:NAD(P)-dependent oxidoreductase [Prevotellaceae bacterium]